MSLEVGILVILALSGFSFVYPRKTLVLTSWLVILSVFKFSRYNLNIGISIAPVEAAFYATLPGLIIRSLLRYKKYLSVGKQVPHVLIFLIGAGLVISSVLSDYNILALKGAAGVIQWFILYMFIVLYSTPKDIKYIVYGWSILLILLSVLWLFVGQFDYHLYVGRVLEIKEILWQAKFALNNLATLILISLAGCWYYLSRFRVIMCAVLLVLGFATGSGGFLVGAFVFVSYAFVVAPSNKNYKLLSIATILFVLSLVTAFTIIFSEDTVSYLYEQSRLEIYQTVVERADDFILTGYGPGVVNEVLLTSSNPDLSYRVANVGVTGGVHNAYLQVLVDGGLIVGILVGIFWYTYMYYSYELLRFNANGGKFAMSAGIVLLTMFLFYSMAWSSWAWIVAAIPFVLTKRSKKRSGRD